MMMTYMCMSNTNHLFKGDGRNMDGISCPICKSPVLNKPYNKEEHSTLPKYRDLLEETKRAKSITYELKDVEVKGMTIELDGKFKMVSAMLEVSYTFDGKKCTSILDAMER